MFDILPLYRAQGFQLTLNSCHLADFGVGSNSYFTSVSLHPAMSKITKLIWNRPEPECTVFTCFTLFGFNFYSVGGSNLSPVGRWSMQTWAKRHCSSTIIYSWGTFSPLVYDMPVCCLCDLPLQLDLKVKKWCKFPKDCKRTVAPLTFPRSSDGDRALGTVWCQEWESSACYVDERLRAWGKFWLGNGSVNWAGKQKIPEMFHFNRPAECDDHAVIKTTIWPEWDFLWCLGIDTQKIFISAVNV
jgi:hypothetical protein